MLRVFIVFHLLVLLLQGAALASDDLSGTLKGIQKKYGGLPGFSIPYTREVITRSMSMLGNQVKGDLATGQMFYKPPHFLRLEQKTPEAETIITNGDSLWWYIPGKKRAYQYPSQEFGKELRLLSDIFHGLMRVEETFHVAMLGPDKQGEIRIELRPNPPWQEVDRIILTVIKGYNIRMIGIHNQLGGITRFTLKNLIVKDKFEKGFFQFIAPEGVELIKKEGKLQSQIESGVSSQ